MLGIESRNGPVHNAQAASKGPGPLAADRVTELGQAPPRTALVLDDQALIDAIEVGDTKAASALWEYLLPSIRRSLYRVIRAEVVDFDDLVQITFERVIRTIIERRFEGRSQLRTWASVIAAHVALDWLRRRTFLKQWFEPLDDLNVERRPTAVLEENRFEARAELDVIQCILNRMKPGRAAVLVLHDVHGYSAPEVAALLGIGIGATESRLRRARLELRRRYNASIPSSGAFTEASSSHS